MCKDLYLYICNGVASINYNDSVPGWSVNRGRAASVYDRDISSGCKKKQPQQLHGNSALSEAH